MLREDAHRFVRQLEEAVNAHDIDRLLEFYSEVAVTLSPVYGEIAGLVAVRNSWEAIFSLFPDWTVKVTDVLLDGDRVAFMGTAAATDRNGWFGQPATGERIEYRAVIVLTMAHGKIVRDERIYDLTSVVQCLEKAQLDKELSMAAEVQRALVTRKTHETRYCEAMGDSIACRAIGGDFFELVDLPSGDCGVALGDVSGKGPAAAILAAMIQGMLAVEVENKSTPSAILTRLNRLLAVRPIQPRFATLVLGTLSSNGRFVYSNAGHNQPILLTPHGVRRLGAGGPILGPFAESRFAQETVCLSDGDTIIMFSDGVTEARNARDEEFGEDRLISYVTDYSAESAAQLLHGVFKTIQEFCQGVPQTDDMSVAVARFHGS